MMQINKMPCLKPFLRIGQYIYSGLTLQTNCAFLFEIKCRIPLRTPCFYSTLGFAFQEGSCHTSRTEGHVLPSHPWSEEEPLLTPLHLSGSHHKRNSRRGQCQRAGLGHTRRKGYLGWVHIKPLFSVFTCSTVMCVFKKNNYETYVLTVNPASR